jgi:hypothetical protein
MVLQDASSVAREGLPYWTFYLLLCLILLLVAFIFLRDKDLRMRLNEFLSGAKKRMKRTQMQIRLKRENKRKTDHLKELGRRAWGEKLSEPPLEPHFRSLDHLDRLRAEKQAELKDILARIIELQRKISAAGQAPQRPRKEENEGEPLAKPMRHAAKNEERQFRKEIQESEKKIREGQEFLKSIDIRKSEQFVRIGAILDDGRPEHKDFLGIYVQIDKLNRKILHYIDEIDKFR